MRKKINNQIEYYLFHHLESFSSHLGHAILTKHGGFSTGKYQSLNVSFHTGDNPEHVESNRLKLLRTFNLTHILTSTQPHGTEILVIKDPIHQALAFTANSLHNEIEGFDALITNQPNLALMLKVADCQAILLYDPIHQVIAAIHAGWRGQKNGIIEKTIQTMTKQFQTDPAHLYAGISPSLSIAAAHFTDPEQELGHPMSLFRNQNQVDLVSYTEYVLQKQGLQSNKIERSRICTYTDPKSRFFSHRKQDLGRNGALIWLTQT